jgi:hypothetical protein
VCRYPIRDLKVLRRCDVLSRQVSGVLEPLPGARLCGARVIGRVSIRGHVCLLSSPQPGQFMSGGYAARDASQHLAGTLLFTLLGPENDDRTRQHRQCPLQVLQLLLRRSDLFRRRR